MLSLLSLLGVATSLLYLASLSNYFAKPALRALSKRPALRKMSAPAIRFLLKHHKPLGLLALISAWNHYFVALRISYVLPSGYAALVLITFTSLLGLAGAFYFKSPRGRWKTVHRSAAFLLLIVIFTHVVFKW